MNRRSVLLLVAAGVGCGTGPARESLPESLGPWKRVSVEDLATGQASEIARRLGLRRARKAAYEGRSKMIVTVYEMNSSATPFELMQKWRVEPKTLPFYSGAFFFVIESETGDMAAMKDLAGLLEKAVA